MSDRSQQNLTEGPVWRSLLVVSAPMSLGIFGVLAIGLADAYFLARAGQNELAAIGFIYPIIVAISAMSIGLSAGANAAISQAMGAGRKKEAIVRLILHGAGIACLLGICIAVLLWQGAPLLFGLLGAQGAVLENVLAYVPFWAASFPFLTTTMLFEASFRAHGDGGRAAFIMVFTAIVNIALTPLLVFGYWIFPEMGMAGAGMSTLIARFLALGLALSIAYRREIVQPVQSPLQSLTASARKITAVGFPAALSRGVNPAGMAIVTAAVATVGEAAVAGFGAAARVQSIALIPFLALASGLAPVIGQSWGKGDGNRAGATMQTAALFCVFYGVVVGIALIVFADLLADIMTASGEAARYTSRYLQVVGLSLFGYGIVLASNAALTARSRASWALAISLTRIGILYVPLAWIGVSVMGYTGILVAAVVANVAIVWLALVITQANALWPYRIPVVAPQADALNRLRVSRNPEEPIQQKAR